MVKRTCDCDIYDTCEAIKKLNSGQAICPLFCSKWNCYICPECGANMTTDGESDDMEKYTHGHCPDCSFTCCGGCI